MGSKADKRRIQTESELRERHPNWGGDYALLAGLVWDQLRHDRPRAEQERIGRVRVISYDKGPHGQGGRHFEPEGHWAMLRPSATNGEYPRARELVESLGPEDRELVQLRYYDGLSLRGIANLLKVHNGTVLYRLRRIERELSRHG